MTDNDDENIEIIYLDDYLRDPEDTTVSKITSEEDLEEKKNPKESSEKEDHAERTFFKGEETHFVFESRFSLICIILATIFGFTAILSLLSIFLNSLFHLTSQEAIEVMIMILRICGTLYLVTLGTILIVLLFGFLDVFRRKFQKEN